jgi:hypothetical protein
MQLDSAAIFAEVKADAERLAKCKRHLFNIDLPPYAFGQKSTCVGCGGSMKLVDALRYVQGYEAAGGNPNTIIPGWNPEWKQEDPDMYTPEEVGELVYRFACILEHATGGQMSKTNYTLEAMRAVIDDHVNAVVDEALKEQAEDNDIQGPDA